MPLISISSECVFTSPHRCGVSPRMALVQSTFSLAWEDSCKQCCLVILASGQLAILSPCTVKTHLITYATRRQKIDIMCFFPRVQRECLAFSPLLPKDISELCIRGVNYLGSQMDWLLRENDVCIILREQASSAGNAKPCDLQVVLKASGTKIPLTPGNT